MVILNCPQICVLGDYLLYTNVHVFIDCGNLTLVCENLTMMWWVTYKHVSLVFLFVIIEQGHHP
jgi:hypothetical protein